jgi:hypothetical protein
LPPGEVRGGANQLVTRLRAQSVRISVDTVSSGADHPGELRSIPVEFFRGPFHGTRHVTDHVGAIADLAVQERLHLSRHGCSSFGCSFLGFACGIARQ